MRLSEFIATHREEILQEWEDFARNYTEPGKSLDPHRLRDHAAGILRETLREMERTRREEVHAAEAEEERAPGDIARAGAEGEDAQDLEGSANTAAGKHGVERAELGFTREEMFSEYRALRSSVLRLWSASRDGLDEIDMQDAIRFNEAIDQALVESITRYTAGIERARETFLAILGHDLRTPLGVVVMASGFLEHNAGLSGEALKMATRIHRSSLRMGGLVRDLLDFTRFRLGAGIPIDRSDADMADLARAAIEEMTALHPEAEIRFEATGDLTGDWDGERVSQTLSNLIGNAIEHGSAHAPITVSAAGEPDDVVISVHNVGSTIPEEDQERIFAPFKSAVPSEMAAGNRERMGLGLYIAQQIALAHGGLIEVASSSADEGTTFELRLPRRG